MNKAFDIILLLKRRKFISKFKDKLNLKFKFKLKFNVRFEFLKTKIIKSR